MDDLRSRVAGEPVARLATLDRDGRPHLVPIVFALLDDTLYTAVDAKPKRSGTLRRIENARERPDVTVIVDRYEDDWTALVGQAPRARARPGGGDEAVAALAALTAKYEQYRESPPGLPVLAVDVADWRPGARPRRGWRNIARRRGAMVVPRQGRRARSPGVTGATRGRRLGARQRGPLFRQSLPGPRRPGA